MTPQEADPFKTFESCNWTEDYSHENGNYINICNTCGFHFKGHKRRVTCKMCSEFTLEEWKKIAAMKTPEDTKHAHAGCWLQGEMVGYARCMVKWLESAPKKESDHDHECTMDLMTDVCVYSCECGKIEVASNLSYHDKPKTYIPESAPKKSEESEDHLWYFVFQTYGGEFYHAAPRDEAAIISRIKREFEIKRKPL